MTRIIITFFIFLSILSCSDNTQRVEIIPGNGIILNSDSIIIYKCSPEDLCKLTNLKDTFKLEHVDCEAFDKNSNAIDIRVPFKIITLDNLQFNFSGQADDKLVLKRIFIKTVPNSSSLFISKKLLTDTSFSLVGLYPNSVDNEMTTGGDLAETSHNGITFFIDSTQKKILTINIHEKEK